MNIKDYINEFKYIIFFAVAVIAFTLVFSIISVNSRDVKASVENNDIKEEVESVKNNIITFNRGDKIKVYITAEDKVEEISVEEYVCGVVSNEMPISFNEEALKAQAVASRTYLASKLINKCSICDNADICDSTHCQVYTSKEKRMSNWEESKAEEYWSKIERVVKETEGKILTYNGELVLYPQFFSTSSGKTENSEDINWGSIPYLKSVESPGEEVAPKYTSESKVSISDVVSKINEKYPSSGVNLENICNVINIISRSEAGGVKSIELGNETVTGSEFRILIGLNSTNFTYSFNDNNMIFNCRGYGHGVGMSQWGANVMGKGGSSYSEILKHYYTGVDIGELKFE